MFPFYQISGQSVRDLIRAGADVNMRDNIGATPLHRQKVEGAIRELIKAGADVKSRDHLDRTPLHYQKDVGAIRELIKAGSDVNAKDILKSTPLHNQHNKKVVYELILAGADANAKDTYGYIPYKHNDTVKEVVDDISSKRITRFIKNCKWFKLLRLTKTFAFNRWYCGEEENGNGGGVGRMVDHRRIMEMDKW